MHQGGLDVQSTTKLTVKNVELIERPLRLRFPFKFGVITLTEAPQLFLKLTIEDENGKHADGYTAELMVPKWFDKNKDLSHDDNFNQLRRAVAIARGFVLEQSEYLTAWKLHADMQGHVHKVCESEGLNPLIASFGVAQFDKAILDAVCRLNNVSFYAAIQNNIAGMSVDEFDIDAVLKNLSPLKFVEARHTIGLADALTVGEIDQPLKDGLPQSLDQVCDFYGQSYFKIKVNGNLDTDIERLCNIAKVLDALDRPYYSTLDGNEQYQNAAHFTELVDAISKHENLKRLKDSILYIEQPIHRDRALEHDISALSDVMPVILDESDCTDDIFVKGKDLGYRGISSKACKGLYRSLLNCARAKVWNAAEGAEKYFLSAEDLTTQAGLAVQQDLALISLMGLTHVERNGHHYVHGMSGASEQECKSFADMHSGLYRFENGKSFLNIKNGKLDIASLDCTGYASSALPIFDDVENKAVA